MPIMPIWSSENLGSHSRAYIFTLINCNIKSDAKIIEPAIKDAAIVWRFWLNVDLKDIRYEMLLLSEGIILFNSFKSKGRVPSMRYLLQV
jgi:hypothetical protein